MLLVATLVLGPLISPLADVSFDLYGTAAGGWSFTPGDETTPGPTITVDEGDGVTLALYSDDGLPHQFLLDYDDDGAFDTGEPRSGIFTDSETLTFSASTPGTFDYICTIHALSMYGTWNTQAAPEPVHDVAVTAVTTDKTSVEQGEIVTVSVTVVNEGEAVEASTVRALAGGSEIGSQVVSLDAGASDTVNFGWDTTGVPVGDYLIRGEIDAVSGETDTADNAMDDGTVTVSEPPPPPPPGGGTAALAGRRAWPDHHHFVISRHGNMQSLNGKVVNTGTTDVTTMVRFTIYDDAGALVGTVDSNAATLPEGGIGFVSALWSVSPGRYSVVAQCWFDSDGDGSFDMSDPNTKTFGFAVVP